MSGDQLNLDALDEMYHRGGQPTLDEGKALVAEVRRLREREAELLRTCESAARDIRFLLDPSTIERP